MKLCSTSMNHIHRSLAASAVMLAAVICGCTSDAGTGESQDSDVLTASRGEHDRESGEHGGHDRDGHGHHNGHGEEGEESGTELALNENYDRVRNGARLVLAYDAQSNSFNGTVENTTDKTLERVRVEVHLSNGKELGPTTPVDLKPGEKRDVKLAPKSKDFDGWTTHPEVGNEEHSHGDGHREGPGEHGHGKENGEHDREGRGEHKESHKEGDSE